MEDTAQEYEKEDLLKVYFSLLNPYKGGLFSLVKLKSKSSSVPLDSPPSQRSLNSSSHISPLHSPRKTEPFPVPKLPVRSTGLDSRRGSVSSPDVSPSKELSNRSSTTLLSMTSPRLSGSIGRSVGKIVALPDKTERSRSSSVIESQRGRDDREEAQEKKEVDHIDESREPTVTFKPINVPTLKQRLKFDIVSEFDEQIAGRSKSRKDSFIGSVRSSRVNTPVQSLNSSPILSPKKADIEYYDFWNEIIEGSGFFLGMQPRRINHPFLLENPEYSTNSSTKPFLLNPLIFSNPDLKSDAVLGCVFTFQESLELRGGYLKKIKIITHNDFYEYGILTKWLPIKDDTGDVNVKLALNRLLDMMGFYLRDLPIYLNCKSGKGRSAMFAILFFIFCFLLDKRVGINKAYLNLYMTEKDLVIDSDEYNDLWQHKRTRLLKIVERISPLLNGRKLVQEISPDEIPDDKLLKELFSIYEEVVISDRKIKLSSGQRNTGLVILKALTECLYSSNVHKSHSSSKLPNDAFIDDLTQTNVMKDIHIHMDGIEKEDICCKSFQEFLVRLVNNVDGWYEELINGISGSRFVEGECGYFTKTSIDEDRIVRIQLLKQFKKEIDVLIKKHPTSDYAKSKYNKTKDEFDAPEEVIDPEAKSSTSPPKSSPRTFSGNLSSPRVRSYTLSKEVVKQTLAESAEEGNLRSRSRTFSKASQVSSPLSISPRLSFREAGGPTSPRNNGVGSVVIAGFSSPRKLVPVAKVSDGSSGSDESGTDEDQDSSSLSL